MNEESTTKNNNCIERKEDKITKLTIKSIGKNISDKNKEYTRYTKLKIKRKKGNNIKNNNGIDKYDIKMIRKQKEDIYLNKEDHPCNVFDIIRDGKKKEEKKTRTCNIFNIVREDENKEDNNNFLISSKNRKRIVAQEYVKYILATNKIIYINNKLYIFDEKLGYYKILTTHNCEVLIMNHINENHEKLLVQYDIDSIYKFIMINPKIQMSNEEIPSNDMFINCRNCVVDIINNKELKHDSKYYFYNCINAEYKYGFNKEEFKQSYFYNFINQITQKNKELKNLIQEIIGYSLSNLWNAKKFFIFYGLPNSGKSVILDLLEYIVGEENVSHIPLQRLVEDKFSAELNNKLLNTYNELPDEGIKDLGAIKALVSPNDKVISRKLYQDPFSFINKAAIIFATNNLPEIQTKLYKDNTAFFNRVIIIPFLHSIPESEQDKNLIYKLKEERNIIFNWGIKGLKRYIKNGYMFSNCEISEKYLEDYKKEENLIERFVQEKIIVDKDKYIFFDDLKKQFEIFANENGKKNINYKENKYLKESIKRKFSIEYSRIHRKGENKWGFHGIAILK